MRHAIDNLKQRMFTTIQMDSSKDKEDKDHLISEITAYVKAINELELFYEGEKVTDLRQILYNYDLD